MRLSSVDTDGIPVAGIPCWSVIAAIVLAVTFVAVGWFACGWFRSISVPSAIAIGGSEVPPLGARETGCVRLDTAVVVCCAGG